MEGIEHVREVILLCVAILLGLALTVWGLYMIVRYYRTPRAERKRVRPYVYFGWPLLLIGSGDLAKAVIDLIGMFA